MHQTDSDCADNHRSGRESLWSGQRALVEGSAAHPPRKFFAQKYCRFLQPLRWVIDDVRIIEHSVSWYPSGSRLHTHYSRTRDLALDEAQRRLEKRGNTIESNHPSPGRGCRFYFLPSHYSCSNRQYFRRAGTYSTDGMEQLEQIWL